MSAAIDTIEHMFEHGGMSSSAAAVAPEPDAAAARVRELQARIRGMEKTTLPDRGIPTPDAVGALLPGGALQQGSAYSLDRSSMLLMALLAAPSAAGTWCAVVGMPEFGVEAAQDWGIRLDRLVLVPTPGEHWLTVTAAIADVMGVVAVRPPAKVSDGQVSKLAARLRQRGSTLLVIGSWPGSEAMLSISGSSWQGIGAGHGHLAAREVTLTVTHRSVGRPRSARLMLPDRAQALAAVAGGQRPQHLRAVG